MGELKDNYSVAINGIDITKYIDGLTWDSNIETLGSSFSFSVPESYFDKHAIKCDIKKGYRASVKNNGKEIFKGMVVDTNLTSTKKEVLLMDYAFLMNKSEHVLQFKKISGKAAIENTCNKFGIPIESIYSINIEVNKIYNEETVSAVFQDIMEMHKKSTGEILRMEMLRGKLRIFKCKDELIDPYFKRHDGMPALKISEYLGADFSLKESIMDEVNSVLVISDKGTVIATAKNSQSQKDFGLLQDIIKVSDEEAKRANTIASEGLISDFDELNVTLLGDDSILAGRSIKLTGIFSGTWIIENASHSIDEFGHKTTVGMRRSNK